MKNFKRAALAVSGVAASLAAVSSKAAGITDAIQTAATQATTDIGTAGGIIIGVVVAIAAVAWVRRVVH